jgi:hypothetical protein
MSSIDQTWVGTRPYAETFRSEFPNFTFVFEYDGGRPYEIRFHQSDIDSYIAAADKVARESLENANARFRK